VVLRGAAEIFIQKEGKDRRVAIAGPGELIGFMAVITGAARTNTQLTRLISHARLRKAGSGASELEAALHGQLWRADART
jgi:CRP-like cAMP-binding protein